ncbi:MAG: hypothetical protein K2H29_07965 [Oscillospiraceae bacterium]|nr:hypothetical protein [Oscillospiraceae bacterium]
MILRLTDAFEENAESDIEVKVTMININYGHNKELLNACKPLDEYAWFVETEKYCRVWLFVTRSSVPGRNI